MRNINFILCLTVLLTGCDGVPVAFVQPQPANYNKSLLINKGYTGAYEFIEKKGTKDSLPYSYYESIITVKPGFISKSEIFKLSYNKTDTVRVPRYIHELIVSMDTSYKEGKKSNVNAYTKFTGDTVYFEYSINSDTIYWQSSINYVLKEFENKYYINKKIEDGAWKVLQFYFSGKELTIGSISSNEDEELLSNLTSYKLHMAPKEFDSTGAIAQGVAAALQNISSYSGTVNPSQKEFFQFINKGGFHDKRVYKLKK